MIRLSFELDTVQDLACLTDIMDALLQRTPRRTAAPDTWPFPADEAEVETPQPAEQTSEAAAKPAEQPATSVEEVRKALATIPKESALEVLNKFGAKKVGDLKTDDYAAVVAATKEL